MPETRSRPAHELGRDCTSHLPVCIGSDEGVGTEARDDSVAIRVRGDAYRRDQDPARHCRAPPCPKTGLGPVKRDRQMRPHDRIGEIAACQVHRRRGVE